MSILHVNQIQAQLQRIFDGKIDLSDYVSKPEPERDVAFLSRALAAFSLVLTADASPDKAAECITDGGQDNGIDAVYFDDVEKVLYLVQSKWKQDGHGSIERGDGQKFIQGAKDLVNVRFDRFNTRIRARSAEIQQALLSANTRINLLIVYTGQEALASEVERDFQDFVDEMNDVSDIAYFRVLRQVNIHSAIASGTLGSPIDFDVVLRDWGQVREPYQAYFGYVAAPEVAAWWERHHPRLFAPNLRTFLGVTEINQQLVDTLISNPDNFWYFNNGITAICAQIRKKPLGGAGRDNGVFECVDVRIVNGAQTVGAIATAHGKAPESVALAHVLVRFISLEQCPPDFAVQVTRATNTQNRIERRDFVSLDPEQERLRTELQLDGVEYSFKGGDSPKSRTNGFDLEEATVALACAHADLPLTMQAKREIGKLWEDITKAPYKALFNGSVTSVRLWRAVRVLRTVEEWLTREQKSRSGREAMVTVHGNRFITRQVFRRLITGALTDDAVDFAAVLDSVQGLVAHCSQETVAVTNSLFPDSYLAAVFKNATKCREIELRMA